MRQIPLEKRDNEWTPYRWQSPLTFMAALQLSLYTYSVYRNHLCNYSQKVTLNETENWLKNWLKNTSPWPNASKNLKFIKEKTLNFSKGGQIIITSTAQHLCKHSNKKCRIDMEQDHPICWVNNSNLQFPLHFQCPMSIFFTILS